MQNGLMRSTCCAQAHSLSRFFFLKVAVLAIKSCAPELRTHKADGSTLLCTHYASLPLHMQTSACVHLVALEAQTLSITSADS